MDRLATSRSRGTPGGPRLSRRALLAATSSATAATLASCSTDVPDDSDRPGLDPEAFGATGDGRSDDTAALTRCLQAARQQQRPVRLRAGATYRTGGLDCSGLTILGSGAALVARDAAVVALLSATRPVILSDLELRPPAPGAGTRIGLRLHTRTSWSAPCRIAGLRVVGGSHAVRVEGRHDLVDPANTPRVGAVISDASLLGCGTALQVSGVRDLAVRGLAATGTTGDAVVVQHAHDVRINGSTIAGAGGHGLVVQYSSSTTVEECVVRDCGRGGAVIGGGDRDRQPAVRFTLRANRLEDNAASGIICDPTISGREGVPVAVDGVLEGNVARGNGQHGIVVTCAADLDVVGNTCSGNGQDGIAVSSYDVRVASNTCSGNGWSGISFYGATDRPQYGGHQSRENVTVGNARAGVREARTGLVVGGTDRLDGPR